MPRRLFVLALGAAVAAALVAGRRRAQGDPAHNGGRERTVRLKRELEQARERLREELARARDET